jgi:hypothetical protein
VSEFPRDLTPKERDILDFVIAANVEHRAALGALLREARATPNCSCGCGSITLTTDSSKVEERTWPTPLDAVAVADIEGGQVIAMLFADIDSAGLEFVHGTRTRPRLPGKHALRVRWEGHAKLKGDGQPSR